MNSRSPHEPVDRYEHFQPRTLRAAARHAALDSLAALQRLRGACERELARPRVHFLYLHSVFPDEQAGFRALLRALARQHRFIGYDAAVERVRSGPIDAPYIALSFDDGFRNGLAAAEIMAEFGATACFFVCSSAVGEVRPKRISAFCRQRLRSAPVELLSWRELERLKKAGHEIGSHTRTHADLAALGADALEEELVGSREELTRRLGEVRHFAWPFGRFSNARAGVAEAARRAGYASCASAVRGCHSLKTRSAGQALCLRREHVVAAWPPSHTRYFLARSAARVPSPDDNLWPSALRAAPGAA